MRQTLDDFHRPAPPLPALLTARHKFNLQQFLLRRHQRPYPARRQLQQILQLHIRVRPPFRARLHFHKLPAPLITTFISTCARESSSYFKSSSSSSSTIPTLVAAKKSISGTLRKIPAATIRSSESASATYAPVTEAVRVPPSA